MHARFVPHGDGVRRIDPIGATQGERVARYQAFVPAPRYLRHDARPPAFLRGLVPDGRTLANPLFAGPETADLEAQATYPPLLRRLATPGRPLDVVHTGGVFAAVAAATASGDLRFHAVELPAGLPYFARSGHLSPLGNRWLAARIVDLLLERPPSPPPVRLLPAADAGVPAGDVQAVGDLDALTIRLDDRPVGELVGATPGASGMRLRPRRRLPASARWLVGFTQDVATPLADAVFVTADAAKPPPAALVAAGRRLALPATTAARGLALARVDVCTAALRAALGAPADAACELATPRRARWTASVELGGVRVLDVGVADGTVLVRPAGAQLLVRARGDLAPALPDAARGDVWLTGLDAGGAQHRARLAVWLRPGDVPPAGGICAVAPGCPAGRASGTGCQTCNGSS